VKKKTRQFSELAALHALGALDGEDARVFASLLAENPEARAESKSFAHVPEALARSLPSASPPPGLKERILAEAERSKARQHAGEAMKQLLPRSDHGLAFLRAAEATPWIPLPVAGASVKLLSYDEAAGYAVVLGKLEAGSRYPGHRHIHPEDIFMISGDLHVGEEIIRGGDFHHANAGSEHGVNWSEEGCVLLCVLSKEDLLNQLAPA
jgi:anti-sigma factor ChrR (cupin superfamily)